MHSKKLVSVSILAAAAALALSGCGKSSFVTVNNAKITKDEFYSRLERLPVDGKPAGITLLDKMIDEKIVEQLAKEKKVEPTEKQIQAKIDFQKKDGNLKTILKDRALTLDEYKKELYTQQAFINIVTKGVNIPDKEAKDYYDRNKATVYTRPETIQIGAIICKTKDKIGKAQTELNNGTEFSTVATNLSDDPGTKASGGELGIVWKGRQGVPPVITDTAFKLKVGNVSAPVQIGPQWVILKAIDRKPQVVFKYDDVKDQIIEGLKFAKGQEKTDVVSMIKKARDNAKIGIKADQYKMLGKSDKTEGAKKS